MYMPVGKAKTVAIYLSKGSVYEKFKDVYIVTSQTSLVNKPKKCPDGNFDSYISC